MQKKQGGGKFNVGNLHHVSDVTPVEENLNISGDSSVQAGGSWGSNDVASEPNEDGSQLASGWGDNPTEPTSTTTTTGGNSDKTEEKKSSESAADEKEKPHPFDEAFGKKTYDQYQVEEKEKAEALAKLVGTVEKRTQLEKKVDLSKFIEPIHRQDEKLLRHEQLQQQQQQQQSGKVQKAAGKPKGQTKTIEFNDLLKQEGILEPVYKNTRLNNQPGNRRVNPGHFPILGEDLPQEQQQEQNDNQAQGQGDRRGKSSGGGGRGRGQNQFQNQSPQGYGRGQRNNNNNNNNNNWNQPTKQPQQGSS